MTYFLGLTGGIATGKSTVSQMFKDKNIPVVDADVIARSVVTPESPVLAGLVDAFGQTILTPNHELDRKALGQIVFNDDQARERMNAIYRPYLRKAIDAQLREAAKQSELVVGDIPLLFEANYQDVFDGVAVVTVDVATQRKRLMARNQLSQEAADKRIKAQMPLADKVKRADYVIDNQESVAHTKSQVDHLIKQLSMV
ncbi:dephospho-CoA kinase [Lacticaseibacillus saniviri]